MSKHKRVANSPLWRLAVGVHMLIAGKKWRRSMRDMIGLEKFTLRRIFDDRETSAAGIVRWENVLRDQILRVRRAERAAYLKRDAAMAALYDRIEKIQEARVMQAERALPAPDPDWLDAAIREQYPEIIEWRPAR
jgi:hypothetical protein